MLVLLLLLLLQGLCCEEQPLPQALPLLLVLVLVVLLLQGLVLRGAGTATGHPQRPYRRPPTGPRTDQREQPSHTPRQPCPPQRMLPLHPAVHHGQPCTRSLLCCHMHVK